MDRDQLLAIAAVLGALLVAGVGAWFASRYVGWTWTLAGGSLAIAAFAALLRRMGRTIFYVALAVVIVATGRLLDDRTQARPWVALAMGGVGLVVGLRTGAAETEARLRPSYPHVSPDLDAGDGPA